MICPHLADLPVPPEGKTGWPWTEESEPLSLQGDLPKISIVTPSFNQGEFIEETIRAVLLQGYPDIEYIICDGGSSDETVEIIRKYEKWIDFWVSEPDHGQSDAINKGFRKCSGTLAAWINSDDFYEKGALWKAAEMYLAKPESSVIYGNCLNFSQDGTILTVPYRGEYRRKNLLQGQYFQQPATFFNRKYLEDINYINEEFHYCMDYDLFFRLCEKGPVAYCDSTLARFRYQDNSKTVSQNYKFLIEIIIIFDRILRGGLLKDDAAAVDVALTRMFWSGVKLIDFGLENLKPTEIPDGVAVDNLTSEEWISYLLRKMDDIIDDAGHLSKTDIRKVYDLFRMRYHTLSSVIRAHAGKRHLECAGYHFLEHHPKAAEGFGVAVVTYYPDMFCYRKKNIVRYVLGRIFGGKKVWRY